MSGIQESDSESSSKVATGNLEIRIYHPEQKYFPCQSELAQERYNNGGEKKKVACPVNPEDPSVISVELPHHNLIPQGDENYTLFLTVTANYGRIQSGAAGRSIQEEKPCNPSLLLAVSMYPTPWNRLGQASCYCEFRHVLCTFHELKIHVWERLEGHEVHQETDSHLTSARVIGLLQ